ncbi:MAG: flagellar assembly protein FliH [Candidatus Pelagadaptatus aseana]|uniref:flagellar assembly protein FliH n=1 Tax=Candidatus Pelagadaptatus aseana TaxID=3120508 RepID=UPI0039B2C6E7
MSSKMPVLITAEEAADYQAWSLPGFDGDGNVLPTAEKEARDRQSDAITEPEETPQAEPAVEEHQEIIEDVTAEEVSFSPITAEELQAITDAAEQEGFAKGKAEGVVSGHKEGLDRGYQEGLKKAQVEAAQKLNEQVGQLQAIAQSLMQPIAEQQHQIERMLVDFTCALTRQLVERELTTDSSHVLITVKEALAALPVGAENITLFLNPDDLALVESYAERQGEKWQFIGDADLLPGGCRLKTEASLVDYSVESQLSELLQLFKNKQLVGSDDGSQFDCPEAAVETESEVADKLSASDTEQELPEAQDTSQSTDQDSGNEPV